MCGAARVMAGGLRYALADVGYPHAGDAHPPRPVRPGGGDFDALQC